MVQWVKMLAAIPGTQVHSLLSGTPAPGSSVLSNEVHQYPHTSGRVSHRSTYINTKIKVK